MSKLIDINKKYRTRDGKEVRIYATDGGGDYPIQGAVRTLDGRWRVCTWKKKGKYTSQSYDHPLDLIEIREKHKRTVWILVGEYGEFDSFEDKESALHYKKINSLNSTACIPVEFEFEEGDGL